MNCCRLYLIIALVFVSNREAARILSINLVPSNSHNVMFIPILQELLKRGHEIVAVTTDPIYKKGKTPQNLTEIDIHSVSYSSARQKIISSWTHFLTKDPSKHFRIFCESHANTFTKQIQTPEIQQLLEQQSRKFDLLLLDAASRISIVLSHVFNAPVIKVSTTSAIDTYNFNIGVPTHPILYPQCLRHRLYDLTMLEKIKELYTEYRLYRVMRDTEESENRILKHLFGPETPTIMELEKNVVMLFQGDQPIWEDNRPTPPSVIYIGGINKVPEQPLPKDIKKYLDNSSRDVVYVSFGGNIKTSDLPTKFIEVVTRAFLNLPYNVCWKWDSDKLPMGSPNIKTLKWLPQADFLRHPKVKLFITHAGLRSTEEAIEAGVPVIGIPVFLDQFYNSEKYVRHGIGLKLDMDTLTEQKLIAAINMIMTNKSYAQNVIRLRNIINDQPMSPLERAVWWTEHVLRHGASRHLRAPAAGMVWVEYYEVKLVLAVVFTVISTMVLLMLCICGSIKLVIKRNRPKRKVF